MGLNSGRGLAQLLINHLLEKQSDNQVLKIAFFELYLGKINDLLSGEEDLKIGRDMDNQPEIKELTMYQLSSYHEFEEIYSRVKNYRKTKKTISNAHSSRSHLILRIEISSTDNDNFYTQKSRIQLFDLAGNERYTSDKDTNKILLQESNSINRSLTTLGRVIRALKKNKIVGKFGPKILKKREVKTSVKDIVPYREDVLTQILQPEFQQGSKIVIITTFSPSE